MAHAGLPRALIAPQRVHSVDELAARPGVRSAVAAGRVAVGSVRQAANTRTVAARPKLNLAALLQCDFATVDDDAIHAATVEALVS